VSAYLRDLETLRYAPYTIAARLQQLADTLSVLEPDGDWLWIRRAAGRVRAKARPITDLESRLRSPEEVERLGIDLMNGADRDAADDPLRSALLFRDGLAIATLVHRPLRISNFASIRIGHNLLRDGLLWRVAFPANSMKNRRPYECMWPEPMIAFLEQYLSVHRQILLQKSLGSGEVDALWVTKDGTPIASDALATRIRHHTKAKFGVTINPHSFRGVAATTIATVDPQNNIGVASLLGHSSLETAEKHYIRAKAVDACDRYQATLRRLLQQGRPRYGGGGSNSLT
jgi:integrase